MHVTSVQVHRVRLPFRVPVHTALASYDTRLLLFVRVQGASGEEGWGECSSLEDASYFYESVAVAETSLRTELIPLVTEASEVTGDTIVDEVLSKVDGHPMAKAAIEMAVLDAELKAAGRSLRTHLGVAAERVMAGAAVGMPMADAARTSGPDRLRAIDMLIEMVARQHEAGFRRVKLKVMPGWDVDVVRQVRRELPNLALHVDANGSFEGADLAVLRSMGEQGVSMIDQPLAAGNLVGLQALVRDGVGAPICVDESVTSADMVDVVLSMKAADIVCLKPGRMGGIARTRLLQQQCADAGVQTWTGGMYSSAQASTVERVLSAGQLTGDVSPFAWRFTTDLAPADELDSDGMVSIPDAPGIGAGVDTAAVRLQASTRSPGPVLST